MEESAAPQRPGKSTQRPWLPALQYGAWLVAASLVLLGLVELTCRWLGFVPFGAVEQHPCPGSLQGECTEGYWAKGPTWLFEPGAFRLNGQGDRAPEPSGVRCRVPILFLGDSFTFGQYLSQEEALPQVIARKLPGRLDACVYNGGEVGSHLVRERERFRSLHEALGGSPRIVVHQYYGDDPYQLAGTLNELIGTFYRDRLYLIGIGLASIRLKLAMAWRYEWARWDTRQLDFASLHAGDDFSRLISDYAGQWGEFADEIRRSGAQPIELIIPFPAYLVASEGGHLRPLTDAAAARKVPTLLLSRENLPHDPFLPNDIHFNAGANEEIANLLLPLILDAANRL